MSQVMEEEVKRWTDRRKSALVSRSWSAGLTANSSFKPNLLRNAA